MSDGGRGRVVLVDGIAVRIADVLLDVPVRPVLRVLTEADLFRGYPVEVVRSEPCACGTNAEQLRGEDETAAVTRHNLTPRHAAWSAETRLVP